MKLNPDCIRDILLELEKLDYGQKISLKDLIANLSNYDKKDIKHSCLLLEEGNYIVLEANKKVDAPVIFFVKGMTLTGHELLERLKPQSFWDKTKETFANAKDDSLSALFSLAGETAFDQLKELIMRHLL